MQAYRRLFSGQDRVKYFGPAFFTKWLYFCGYEQARGLKPLILDSRVAATLGWAGWGWAPEQYGEYLRLAHDVAAALSGEGAMVQPDAVEHALYALDGIPGGGIDLDDEPSIVVGEIESSDMLCLQAKAEAAGQRLEDYVREIVIDAARR